MKKQFLKIAFKIAVAKVQLQQFFKHIFCLHGGAWTYHHKTRTIKCNQCGKKLN